MDGQITEEIARRLRGRRDAATAMYREMGMTFWLAQAEADAEA